jgi:hypothetical protein
MPEEAARRILAFQDDIVGTGLVQEIGELEAARPGAHDEVAMGPAGRGGHQARTPDTAYSMRACPSARLFLALTVTGKGRSVNPRVIDTSGWPGNDRSPREP